jgi:hypothetical protein
VTQNLGRFAEEEEAAAAYRAADEGNTERRPVPVGLEAVIPVIPVIPVQEPKYKPAKEDFPPPENAPAAERKR